MKTYKKILAAVNVFEPNKAIIKQANNLKNRFNAELHFVYTLPVIVSSIPYTLDAQEQIKQDAEQALVKLAKECQIDPKNTHACYGNPKHEISDLAKKLEADLIIIGSHGRHGIELMLGATANGVLHTAECDVLTIRVDAHDKHLVNNDYTNIVIAADLEADNQQVITRAKAISKEFNSNLHMINVVPMTTTTAVVYFPTIDIELKKSATQTLADLANKVGIDTKNTKIVVGVPRNEITQFATDAKAELIIIGSHGRNAFNSALLGSTANAVLHIAKQDVLVVRLK